jgi:hypothetical protein
MPEAPVQEAPTTPTETSPEVNTAAPAKVRKRAEKKAAKTKAATNGHTKPVKKAPVAKKAKTAGAPVLRETTPGLTGEQKRTMVLRALKQMGATGSMEAKSKAQIAVKAQLTEFDVYCACYHKNPLQATGLVKAAEHEDVRGLCYYVTAKGLKSLEK